MTRRRATTALFLPALWAAPGIPAAQAKQFNLAAIHGRIQWVTSFPDYKIKIVDAFADLHVQCVTSFPDKPGRWQIVTSFPDFKIQIVKSFPDFTVKYVDSFPGVPK